METRKGYQQNGLGTADIYKDFGTERVGGISLLPNIMVKMPHRVVIRQNQALKVPGQGRVNDEGDFPGAMVARWVWAAMLIHSMCDKKKLTSLDS